METNKIIEIDVWCQTNMISRLRNEIQSLNDIKFDGMDIIKILGVDKRIALFYRVFGKLKLHQVELSCLLG